MGRGHTVVQVKVDDDSPIDIMLEVGYESHFSHLERDTQSDRCSPCKAPTTTLLT